MFATKFFEELQQYFPTNHISLLLRIYDLNKSNERRGVNFCEIEKPCNDGKTQVHRGFATYNPVKIIAKESNISYGKARYRLKKLRETGAVVTSSFNRHKYDRTLWYILSDWAVKIIEKCKQVAEKVAFGTKNALIAVKQNFYSKNTQNEGKNQKTEIAQNEEQSSKIGITQIALRNSKQIQTQSVKNKKVFFQMK
jgi:hypothetical protein